MLELLRFLGEQDLCVLGWAYLWCAVVFLRVKVTSDSVLTDRHSLSASWLGSCASRESPDISGCTSPLLAAAWPWEGEVCDRSLLNSSHVSFLPDVEKLGRNHSKVHLQVAQPQAFFLLP